MRALLLLLFLPTLSWAAATYQGDLNHDGIPDRIVAKGVQGNSGGSFVVTLGSRTGKPFRQTLALNPNATAVEWVDGRLRLWTLWHVSCCEARLSVTTIGRKPETQVMDLYFGASPEAPSLARGVADAVFAGKYQVQFETRD